MRPSKLARVLYPITGPNVFEMSLPSMGFTRTDTQIVEMSIHRGSGQSLFDTEASTLDIKFAPHFQSSIGEHVQVRLSDAAAQALAKATYTKPVAIQHRFAGRIATSTVEDLGPRRRLMSLTAATWLSVLGKTQRTVTARAGTLVTSVLRLVYASEWPNAQKFYTRGESQHFGIVHEPVDAEKVSDIETRFTTDLGLVVRENRVGDLEAWSLIGLQNIGRAAAREQWPIGRQHALAPTTWEQHNAEPPTSWRVITRDKNGAQTSLTYGFGTDWAPVEDKDLRHVRWESPEQWQTLGEGMKARQHTGAYTIPKVTIDILLLLRRGDEYALRLVGLVLNLRQADPVTLAGDWPTYMPGVYYVQAVDERITHDTWTITLHLVQWYDLFGSIGPEPWGRTWGQATGTWGANQEIIWGES